MEIDDARACVLLISDAVAVVAFRLHDRHAHAIRRGGRCGNGLRRIDPARRLVIGRRAAKALHRAGTRGAQRSGTLRDRLAVPEIDDLEVVRGRLPQSRRCIDDEIAAAARGVEIAAE